jgi:predicted amidohydrolase
MDHAAGVWTAVDRLAAEAAEADLLVLPETAYPAFYLESADRYRQPDIERSAAVLERFSHLAAKHSFWLVAGFVEEDQGRLYNSAAVFDRSGAKIGVARKNFLWDCDHQWFTAGDALSVFDTEFGKMGVLICADARVPEIPATLVSDGAQFIVQPTAWVNTTKIRRTYRNIQPDFLIRARATEFGLPFVCCSKAGREGPNIEYVGQSQIVSDKGKILVSAPLGGEHAVGAELTPGPAPTIELDETLRRRLLSSEPPYRPEQPSGKYTVHLGKDVDTIAAGLEAAGVRLGRLKTSDLDGFAPARCHALDGAAVLVVQGRILDDTIVRTRAAENRVFVIVATRAAQMVVTPDGTIAWRRADWQDTLELDLSLADVKQFTPNTDLWAQRRVECFRLGAAAPASS